MLVKVEEQGLTNAADIKVKIKNNCSLHLTITIIFFCAEPQGMPKVFVP